MTTETLAFALEGRSVEVVPISSIVVTPRQRKMDPTSKDFQQHIADLAASIKRVGLLHPPTLEDDTNELIAGFCRVQAFMLLGHTTIPILRRGQLTPLRRKMAELEENLQRMKLEWWEEASAIADIDQMQKAIAAETGEEWSQYKTAEMTGVSTGTVSQAIQVTEAIKANPELKNVSGLVSALNAIKTSKQLEARKETIQKAAEGKIRTYPAQIIQGDALDCIKMMPDSEFDAVLTNFPFGIDLVMGKEQKSIYKDDEDYIVKLVRAVTHEAYRVLKPDSWMVAFFDIRKITYSNKQREFVEAAMKLLFRAADAQALDINEVNHLGFLGAESLGLTYWCEEAGFDYVQLLPCIWAKPNKRQGMIGDPNKGFIMGYEAFILAGKGSPILMRKGLPNLFVYDTLLGSERDIDVQMPDSICTDLVAMVTMGGAKVLDPFAGAGGFGIGALANQCSFVGFELDPERAAVGNLRLQEHVLAKKP